MVGKYKYQGTDLAKGLRTLRRLTGLTDRQIATAARLDERRVGSWMRGEHVPEAKSLLKVVRALIQAVETRPRGAPPFPGEHAHLLDDSADGPWQGWREAAKRVERASNPVLQQALSSDSNATRVRPVRAWNPFHLGVRQPITVSAATGHPLAPLPPYVSRAHDDELAEVLATLQTSLMIMLVGQPATGKTRAAYEAVRRALPDWPLLFPDDPADLLNVASSLGGHRSVLWLDETSLFLDGIVGREVASAIQRLLFADSGPVVVVGTMSRPDWTAYTVRKNDPDAPVVWSPDTPHDTHAQVRLLLLHHAHKIDVPDTFNETVDRRKSIPTEKDPRWAVAVESAGASRRVIQVISGGPVLIDRYEHPGTRDGRYGQALLTAAIDARRLGHQSLLPRQMLADALPAYLDTDERADPPPDWFQRALNYATTRVDGVRALTPHRDLPSMGAADGYALEDVLYQHGRERRTRTPAPATVWASLAAHATNAHDRRRLAHAALGRRLYQIAITFLVTLGDTPGAATANDLSRLSDLLALAGHEEQAKVWRGRASRLYDWDQETPACTAVIDDVSLEMGRALLHMDLRGDPSPEHWQQWYQRGWLGLTAALTLRDLLAGRKAESGHKTAWHGDPVWPYWRSRAEREHADATRVLARLLVINGDLRKARRCLRHATEQRSSAAAAMRDLGHLAQRAGRDTEADKWLNDAAEAGDLYSICELEYRSGRRDEAERMLRHAVEAADPFAWDWLLDLLKEMGRSEEAEELRRCGMEPGGRTAVPNQGCGTMAP